MRLTIIVMLVAAVCTAALLHASRRDATPQVSQRLIIAVGQQPLSALLFIADARGYFAAEGLAVELRPYSHGKNALRAVASGAADLGTVAETPFVDAARAGERLVAVATIESSDKQNLILARKDRGIEGPRDLIHKRVAMIPGTSSEIFLDAFLIAHAIPKAKIEIVPRTPEDMTSALESGAVDAVSAWALPAAALQQKHGPNLSVFSEQGLYVHNWILVARRDRALLKQIQLKKLLRAVLRAEAFETENRRAAIAIVAQRLNLKTDLLAQVWPSFNFNVGLHQYLLINLETHARLSRKNEFEREPNFYSSLMFEPLLAVDPTRVTVVR